MFGWLRQFLRKRRVSLRLIELGAFIHSLKEMDDYELGLSALQTARALGAIERGDGNAGFPEGLSPLQPHEFFAACPDCCLRLTQLIRFAQKQQQPVVAVGLMPWLHTLRTVEDTELRNLVREMWRYIARGFPHVDAWAEELSVPAMHYAPYSQKIPEGFEPGTK